MIVTEVKKEDLFEEEIINEKQHLPEKQNKTPEEKPANKEPKDKKPSSIKKVININKKRKKAKEEKAPVPPVQKYKETVSDHSRYDQPNVSLEKDEKELEARKKEETEEEKKGFFQKIREKKASLRELNKVTSVVPLLDITEEGYVRMEDGQYLGILMLHSGEQRSKNPDDVNRVIYNLQKHLRTMSGNEKWVSLKFPSDMTLQKKYWQRKFETSESEAVKAAIKTKYKELEIIEETRNNIEYYFFCYGKEPESLVQHMGEAQAALRSSFYLEKLKKEKVIQVISKMNNQNSKIMN